MDKYPHIRFHRHQPGLEDIDSQNRLHEFMFDMARLLKGQVEKFKAGRIYVNSAGGRKDALIALSTLRQFLPVSGIFNIVMPDIKTFVELERIRKDIEELGKAEDKRAYYLNKKSLFEPLMYPHLSTFSVIKIPIIPFPPSVLQKLVKILSSSKTEIEFRTRP